MQKECRKNAERKGAEMLEYVFGVLVFASVFLVAPSLCALVSIVHDVLLSGKRRTPKDLKGLCVKDRSQK